MANLSFLEKQDIEKLFGMPTGYVLNFSNRTFQEFVADAIHLNIYDAKYNCGSGSKANYLRGFLKAETNLNVGRLLDRLAEYAATLEGTSQPLAARVQVAARRLMAEAPVADLDAIVAPVDDRTFEALAVSVRESNEAHKPEHGLDRLHTFLVKYLRSLCTNRGLQTGRDQPLHSLFGAYRNYLNQNGVIKSKMTDRILKLSVETLDTFNRVRNEESLAHDNEMLNYDESLFIFNHVCSLVRLLQSIEQQVASQV